MKHIKTYVLALLCAFAGMTNIALAADKTVTYTFSAESDNYSNRWTLTFTSSSGEGFGYSTGTKTATIQNLTNTTGFGVQLDDGLQLSYRRDAGSMTFVSYNSFWLNRQGDENTYLTLTSTHYYVKHVRLATADGDALFGQAAPWTVFNTQMDTDVDMVTQTDGLTFYRAFNAHITAMQTFAQLTVTYGDAPRPYAITFNEVEGLTNPNPATYSVTTADFQVTAPTRIGYDLGNVTYTDAAHPSPTAVTLPMTISRADAVTRKAIAFNAAWTAHTYTLRLHHNDGTDDCTDMTLTYDEAQNIQTVSRTGYIFDGWSTEADGSGTSYTDGQSVSNLTATDGGTVDLYAQWTPITYTLRLHHNDGTDDCTDMTLTYDEAQNIQTVSRTGYIFDGWSTTQDGSIAYTDGQEVLNLTAENGATIDLYAQWVNPSGTCGTSATWEYDHANTTLSISGSGEMDDFPDRGHQPWKDYRAYITEVVISNDITHIGSSAFYNCTALATITGGSGVTSIGEDAFSSSPWLGIAQNADAITYLGHVLVTGRHYKGNDVVVADGTTAICEYAFWCNEDITSVTIPASVTYIGSEAFIYCPLATVNVLATTPPTIDPTAFVVYFEYRHLPRTFNVRNAAYMTAEGWADIYNKVDDYEGYTGFTMRVVSTITLPDGVANSTAPTVSNAGVDYYAEGSDVTLSYTGTVPEGYHVVYSVNGSPISGNTFTMPAEDVTLSTALAPNTYSVRFNANGGSGEMSDQAFTYDAAQALTANAFTAPTGYIFDGWSTTQDGSVAYTDGQEVLNLTAENGATIDLYAQWTNWASVNTLLATDGAVVTLPGDITAGDGDSYLLVPSGVTATLDLNGHTINRNLTSNGWEGGSAIRVEGSLTINDSQGGGCITGGYGYAGGGVCVMQKASFTMNGGTISGNTARYNGGGVMVYSDATCTLNGVTITGNTARNGGGVYVDNSSSCSMTDVTITDNTASYSGGVYAGDCTTFSGLCTITGNTKGGQNNNVYAVYRLYIGGTLDPATCIGINVNRVYNQQQVITYGLNGKGSLDNFFCDVEGDQLSLNDDGEAVITLPPVKVSIYPYSSDFAGFRVTDAEGNVCENDGYYYSALSGTTVYVHVTPADYYGISDVTYGDSWNPTPATFVSAEQREFVFSFVVPYTTDGLQVNANTFGLRNILNIYDNEDNRPTIANYHGSSVNTAYLGYRTLYRDGDWNTLCLPFNVSDLSGTCLEGATLMELGNSSGCNTGFDATTGTLTLDFVPASRIEAGHAYLVKWETTGDPKVPCFENVTVVDENPENQKVVSQDGSVTFVGSYSPVTFTGGDRSVLYLGSNNNLYFPAADRTMGSCRAYFRLNLNAASEVKAFVLNFNEDDADGINSIQNSKFKIQNEGEEWYTLDGRKLNEKPSKGGIYIHNGRKEILK